MMQEADPRQRTDRQVGWLMSLGGVLLLPTQLVAMSEQLGHYAAWWEILVWAQIACLIVLACGGRLPWRLLRLGWVLLPVLGAVIEFTAYAAYTGPSPEALTPWPWRLQAVSTSYLVLLLRPWCAVAGVFVVGLLSVAGAWLALGFLPELPLELLPVRFSNIGFTALFLGIRSRLLRFRLREHELRQQEENAARAEAQRDAHTRLTRIIHDEVLSALNMAAALEAPSPELQYEAARGLALLRGGTERTRAAAGLPPIARDDTHAELSLSSWAQELSHELRALAPACRLRLHLGDGGIPHAVASACSDAAREALRNARKHAGPGAPITAEIRVTSDAVTVRIADRGVGFDIWDVDPARLGVSQSIRRRMSEIGGSAEVVSTIGEGTEVRLEWRRHAAR